MSASTQSLGLQRPPLHQHHDRRLDSTTCFAGLIKAAVFGFIIALMGCYNGFHSRGGAQGVGAATTSAVVSASILILAANYFLTNLLFPD